ncbi:hypothetical protein B0H19DRAFT_1381301 [Mycena capillaripes]|nr:hypothetical protein B0H19DRAFT_1381301 [Mycena capillaripes]
MPGPRRIPHCHGHTRLLIPYKRVHPLLLFTHSFLFTPRCVSLPSLLSHSATSPSSVRPTLTLRFWLHVVARLRAPSTALIAAPTSTAPTSAVKSY